jgi:hypothetical protein
VRLGHPVTIPRAGILHTSRGQSVPRPCHGGDACVVIRDPVKFEERLCKAVAEHLPGWIGMGGPVRYLDPFNCKKDDMSVFFGKHHKYSYQREYRCAWLPPGDPAGKLEPFFAEMGSMRDICPVGRP